MQTQEVKTEKTNLKAVLSLNLSFTVDFNPEELGLIASDTDKTEEEYNKIAEENAKKSASYLKPITDKIQSAIDALEAEIKDLKEFNIEMLEKSIDCGSLEDFTFRKMLRKAEVAEVKELTPEEANKLLGGFEEE